MYRSDSDCFVWRMRAHCDWDPHSVPTLTLPSSALLLAAGGRRRALRGGERRGRGRAAAAAGAITGTGISTERKCSKQSGKYELLMHNQRQIQMKMRCFLMSYVVLSG